MRRAVLLLALLLPVLPAAALGPALPKGVIAVDKRPAPALLVADLDGNPFDLAEHRGHWVFVHFWASWCGPCRKEMPAVVRMAEQLSGTPLRLAIVNTAEDEDTVFSFLGVHAPDVTPLMDRDGQVTERWRPRGLPSTYLVDPDGFIRYQAIGGRPWDEGPYVQFLSALSRLPRQ